MTAADTIREIQVEVRRCTECGARYGVDAAFCPFDGSALASSTWDRTRDPRSKLIVDDRYELLEPLGEGGMGTVYRARHLSLDRSFAMKVLRDDLAADAELAARFVREAKATAAIQHPAVVAITDFGTMPDGIPYFVMELLDGPTLATHIRTNGPLSPRRAARIARQIAEGLQASHDANVIHRDLKPENVFLLARDEVRIVDFGAAKIIGSSKLTRPGVVFGTPYYMAPEQASGTGSLDARADVYSLGIVLYELVTGRVPFEAETYMGVLTKHLFQKPARPASPTGSPLGGLEGIIMRALEKHPEERFPSMTALAHALDRFDKGEAGDEPLDAPGWGRVKVPTPKTTADRIELAVNRRVDAEVRRVRLILGTVALLLAVAVLSVALIVPRVHASSSEEAAAPTASAVPVSVARTGRPAVRAAASSRVLEPPAAAEEPSAEGTAELVPSVRPAPPATTAGHRPLVPPAPRPRASVAPGGAPTPAPAPQSAESFRDPWLR